MFTPEDTAARGAMRRDAVGETIARALAAGLPLNIAAIAAIAVRDAEPWHLRCAPRPVTVALGEGITLTVAPRPGWSQ